MTSCPPALRRLVAALVREQAGDPSVDLWAQSPEAQAELEQQGWAVLSVDCASIRSFLASARVQGLHAATHNDGGSYALLLSRRRIRGVASAAKKMSRALELERPVSVRTLSIRF